MGWGLTFLLSLEDQRQLIERITKILVLVAVRTRANLSAYGVLADDGTIHLVLINKDARRPVSLSVSGVASYLHAEVLWLTAPLPDSRTGISFGGIPVSPTGAWSPAPAEKVKRQ